MGYRVVAAAGCLALLGYESALRIRAEEFLPGRGGFLSGRPLSLVKMIVDLGGYGTPYYAGLNLVFIRFCVVLPISAIRILVHLPRYFIYLWHGFLHRPASSIAYFLANNMFVISTLAIILVQRDMALVLAG